jgi:hypothetical protein
MQPRHSEPRLRRGFRNLGLFVLACGRSGGIARTEAASGPRRGCGQPRPQENAETAWAPIVGLDRSIDPALIYAQRATRWYADRTHE